MKNSCSLLLAASSLLSPVSGLQLNKRHSPAVLPVNFDKKIRQASESLRRRADDAVVDMDVDKHGQTIAYWANFTIGTPPQKLYSELDTGSADLLVLTDEIEVCKNKSECVGNVFSTGKSRTLQWVDSEPEVSGAFGSGETWSGYYANDTFTYGDATIDGLQFVATTEYNNTVSNINSVFGIGLPALENAVDKYANLPYALRNAGHINTAAYSLWLDSDQSGQLLFGGVNKAKYTGPLITFPMPKNNDSNIVDKSLIVMEGFSTTNNGKTTKLDFAPRAALLDTGTIKSRLTLDMTLHMVEHLPFVGDVVNGAVIPCDISDKHTVDFTFGDLTLKAPLKNFLTDFVGDLGLDGIPYCPIFYDPKATQIVLGDDFLRSAYIVFDNENREVSLAAYNPDGGEDDIYEIAEGVPGAAAAKNIPMQFEGYNGVANGDPTSAPFSMSTVTITVLSGATASATGIKGPDSTGEGLNFGKPTETGKADGEGDDDKDSAAVRNRAGSAVSAAVFGFVAGAALLMW